MEPMTARAVLTLNLSPEQREKLRNHEATLPPGRYLMGFEIVRIFQMKMGEIPQDQTNEIDELYKRWERSVLWKANNIEGKRHEAVCGGECKCRTRQEEVWEWEDWIIQNYDQVDENRNWRIPIQTLARITPPESANAGQDRTGT